METDFLIVPMQPTPNGRMHIGHGAGTYLRADVLSRALRVQGHRVRVITGSDAFENWVVAEAVRSGLTPDATCDLYHAEIRRDLDNLGVQMDVWIDPRSPEHFPGYLGTHEEALRRLQETGSAMLQRERIPYSVETGQAIIGTWIAGRCPHCGQRCGGSSCVFCGAHFQPEEVQEPRSRLDNSTLEWRYVQSWFARPKEPRKILESLQATGLRPVWMEAAERYLDLHDGRIRLSGPGIWGIRSNLVQPGFVLANPYYLFSVYCGEVYRLFEGAAVNAFDPHSGVTTIGVFGSDNSTPGLVAPHVIAQGSGGLWKPFDQTVVNGMLFLEGQKCSTSKRHGIWLTELLKGNSGISPDELRFFLVHAPLDRGPADVTLQALVETITAFREWSAQRLAPAVQSVSALRPLIRYGDRVAHAVAEQARWLIPRELDLPAAATVLENWMHDGTPEQGEWLLGLALLGAPMIPNLSQQLWTQLGLEGAPTITALHGREVQPRSSAQVVLKPRPQLSVAALGPYVHLVEANP